MDVLLLLKLYLQLFVSFFKIGVFGFGGGYSMLSLIQGEVVTDNEWLTQSQFANITAVSQMTPGPIGINMATYAGYKVVSENGYSEGMAVIGSAVATLALVLPSFILMLLVIKFYKKYQNHPVVENMLSFLKPTIVGLIAAAALLMMNEENFSTMVDSPWQFCISIMLFGFTFVGVYLYKINPIRMLLYSAVAGILLFY